MTSRPASPPSWLWVERRKRRRFGEVTAVWMQRLCGRGLLLSLAVAAAAVMAARLMGWWRPRASFRLFIPEELTRYRGGPGDPGLYLALLGRVYDVSSGRRHYEPGAHYSGFAGIGEAAPASASSGATPNAHRSFVPWFIYPCTSSPRSSEPPAGGPQLHPPPAPTSTLPLVPLRDLRSRNCLFSLVCDPSPTAGSRGTPAWARPNAGVPRART